MKKVSRADAYRERETEARQDTVFVKVTLCRNTFKAIVKNMFESLSSV